MVQVCLVCYTMHVEKNMFKVLYHTCWKKVDKHGCQIEVKYTNEQNEPRTKL